MVTAERGIVIVGAGLAGAKAAEELRDAGYDGRVILVGRELTAPYDRPPLSKDYLTGAQERDEAFVHASGWYAEHDVELHLGQPATAIDREAKEVVLADDTRLPYDRLLLATGSDARTLDVPGADLAGIHVLRTMPDAERLRSTLRTLGRDNGHLLVVGAGWLGLEIAAAARGHGAEVTVAETAPTALHAVLGAEIGSVFEDMHRAHGVRFEFGAQIAEFRGHDGMVLAAATRDGEELPAHAVAVAIGAAPCLALPRGAGLELAERDEGGGVLVDEQLRTSDPDVFAAGDIVSAPWAALGGRRLRVEHWACAGDGGPVAARAMLGEKPEGPATWQAKVPYFFTDQYALGMEYAGWAPPGHYDQVVVRGEAGEESEWMAFWLKEGRIAAGMNVNVWDVNEQIQQLIREDRPVDLTALADPAVPLTDL
ncbi:FAD-dependent oxidoreductase [Mangrovactinospora gilvigrisea]|uniref:FAD-dependent oxidoreductase n=1 Tax=Mangrovactinospora gilvigrisea TaxID=1428644 RepID=A0A1J7C4A2_9ACTN|nr:FAD-dependent oxidoreductase [Mangrovactinospora gilvigrisea]OIV36376.1 FAD-dependent oxidoreductase [Mangrovactinospora gilvigrisea]